MFLNERKNNKSSSQKEIKISRRQGLPDLSYPSLKDLSVTLGGVLVFWKQNHA